jgi:hypothetical protein
MDRASQVLAQGAPPGVPDLYRALADHSNVPCSTLHHRARGRRSIEEKAQSHQVYPFDSFQCYPLTTRGGQTAQTSRKELGEGSGKSPFSTPSEKSQRVRLKPSREKYIWKNYTLV